MRKIWGHLPLAIAGTDTAAGRVARLVPGAALAVSCLLVVSCTHYQPEPPAPAPKRVERKVTQPEPKPATAHVAIPRIPTPTLDMLKAPSKPDCRTVEGALSSVRPTTAESPQAQQNTKTATPENPVQPTNPAVAPANNHSSPSVPGDAAKPLQGVLAEKALLEFERDCYRSAEERLRRRHILLQKAVRSTKSAIDKLSTN